ncbi:MAG: HD domain-containing protein [Candidatus Eremiobacteraeota bacterium]|nr:HD domain-containing protein [Candidatus Eremiobacteraeota bacterium]
MKRIFDPIHHFIELSDGEAHLLDAPELQRLRRLGQLGLAYLAYPSAEHSRFSHALGALAMGTRAFDALQQHSANYFSGFDDVPYQRRLLRASLLLHDIGHGPFSHACEAVLGIKHEERTGAIVRRAGVRRLLADLEVQEDDLLDLILGSRASRYPLLVEMVSGPNLDADRMDYLLRDSYFTGVANGRYDSEQLIGSLRVLEKQGTFSLGVDGRGVVALESFVLARYMMFATVYFHHTTRMFERILQTALREIWHDPRALDDIDTFLEWDDFRVFDAVRTHDSYACRALRERLRPFAVAAEFNAERDLIDYERCERALRDRFGEHVWGDAQEQLLHRLPLQGDTRGPTILVGTSSGVVDARQASDLIAKLSGKAFWRKLFVERECVDPEEAREICREVTRSKEPSCASSL